MIMVNEKKQEMSKEEFLDRSMNFNGIEEVAAAEIFFIVNAVASEDYSEAYKRLKQIFKLLDDETARNILAKYE